jgi:glycosyltransferase involved in cell wall biosynthesis
MSSQPLVSVVVPAHNEGRWLEGALESLLAQDHGNVEIIVIDDGSSDGGHKIAARYEPRGVRTFRFEETRGEGAARGRGVAEARGEYIVQVDADALFAPDFVSRGLAHFEANPGLSAIALGYLTVHPAQRGIVAEYFRLKRAASHRLRSEGGKDEVAGFFMYRREVVEKIGNYDASVPGGTDLDFGQRLKRAGLTYKWAQDTTFQHADPDRLGTFLRRTFNGSVYWKTVYQRYGMWPTGAARVSLYARSAFITLLPAYVFGALWYWPLAVLAVGAFALEGIVPFIVDRESRTMLGSAVRRGKLLTAAALPLIFFLRIRASSYGKIYADLVPGALERSVTFDV